MKDSSKNVGSIISNRLLVKERSSLMWHKRLGHVFNERIGKLIRLRQLC